MRGETRLSVLSQEDRLKFENYMTNNAIKSCRQDSILNELCQKLEDIYNYNFRDYMHLGIANPDLRYLNDKYQPLNNYRLIFDRGIDTRVMAYAYFDYPLFYAPLYISIVDGERFAPSQMYMALDKVLEYERGYYKTTKENHYPFTIKIYLSENDDEDEDENDLSSILRRNNISSAKAYEKNNFKKDTLEFIHKYANYEPFYLKNYEEILIRSPQQVDTLADGVHELFEVIDKEEYDMHRLRRFMKNYLKDLNSLK